MSSKLGAIQAKKLVELSKLSLEKLNQEADQGYDISFSYGIVDYSKERHSSIEAFMKDGDSEMYSQKNNLDVSH